MPPLPVFEHPLESGAPPYILEMLQRSLPSSLILLRRLQFFGLSSSASLLASFPPDDGKGLGIFEPPTSPFAVGLFDPSGAPDVGVHLFTSADLASITDEEGSAALSDDPMAYEIAKQLAALFIHFHTAHPKPLAQYRRDNSAPLPLEHIILAGNVNYPTAQILKSHLVDDFERRVSPGYQKYIIKASVVSSSTKYLKASSDEPVSAEESGSDLPDDLEWGKVDAFRPDDYALVHSTNEYVRGPEVLAQWPNVALRVKTTDGLAGWAFMGDNGGVRTLYVLSEWRRRGLAQKLVRKLIQACLERFVGKAATADGALVHADILKENEASRKLFAGMGWEKAWDSYWISIDLSQIGERQVFLQ